MDRTEIARALAKAIAYKTCGKHREACHWARKLVTLLECAGILNDYPEGEVHDYQPRCGYTDEG